MTTKTKTTKGKTSAMKKPPVGKEILSITEAARLNNVTRQAIYVAIKLNKLKAKKEEARWAIHINDLDEYRKNKYSRSKSVLVVNCYLITKEVTSL